MTAKTIPRTLLLIDVSVLLHPLSDERLLLTELLRQNKATPFALIGAVGPAALESQLTIGTYANYRADGRARDRVREVLGAVSMAGIDRVVLVAWWADLGEGFKPKCPFDLQVHATLDAPEPKAFAEKMRALCTVSEVV